MYRYVRSSIDVISDMAIRWNEDVSDVMKMREEYEEVKKILKVDDSYYGYKYFSDVKNERAELSTYVAQVLKHYFSLKIVKNDEPDKIDYTQNYVSFNVNKGQKLPIQYYIKLTYGPDRTDVEVEHMDYDYVNDYENKDEIEELLKGCNTKRLYYLYRYSVLRQSVGVNWLSTPVFNLCTMLKKLKGTYVIRDTHNYSIFYEVNGVKLENGVCVVRYDMYKLNQVSNTLELERDNLSSKDKNDRSHTYSMFSFEGKFPHVVSKESLTAQQKLSLPDF